MFAEIVLHRRVPSKFESFTYAVPENLKLQTGQIVKIPFRKQKLSGIVRETHNKTPSYATKFIEEAFSLILPEKQMNLANWMAEFYKSSFSKTIDLFIPDKIWENKKTDEMQTQKHFSKMNSSQTAALKKKINPELQNLIAKLTAKPGKKFLFEKTLLQRDEFRKELIKTLKSDAQALFLYPEIFHAKKLAENAPQFTSELTEIQKAQIWEAVRRGDIKAISGTRAALFLPFKNLSLIVLDFEEHESYTEKRQPHYDALEIAEKIAGIWNATLIVISKAPRVATWHKIETAGYEKYEWENKSKIKDQMSKVEIIDMKEEKMKGNQSFFAEKTIEEIAKHLIKKKQILIFINRRGEAGALLCRDCGNIFRCEKCNMPLILHKENTLECHRCRLKKPSPAECNACKSARLKSIGAGTERLEKEIKKIFAKARIVRLDKEIIKNQDGISQRFPNEKNLKKADIIIATQIIDKPLYMPKLKLAVIVEPDSLLNISDFRAGERLIQLLTHIRHLINFGKMLIQTYIPSNAVYQNFAKNLILNFYENELSVRKELSLPPFKEPNQTGTLSSGS